ncbi:MAG: flagellar hook-associated protein FlgK [Cycloclasticus sp.]|nr:flagellar hook-associated protein FlgK [Cycloclasticus sp.]
MADLLLSGLSGLTAFRSVLDTTGHNIANATTEGYSRQRVELSASSPQLTGAGYVGSGVSTTNISRLYDSFLSTQFRSSSSAASDLDTYLNFASQVDGVLANENIGLSGALQDFFNAVQAVADDPTSIPARQVLLSEGEVLENRFGTLNQVFDDITRQVSSSLTDNINDVNSLGESIASINNKIIVALGGSGGRIPNDLFDQRDKLIDDLSQLVNVSTNVQENGAVNVFIGSGQSLVLGITSNTLSIAPSSDPNSIDILFNQSGSSTIITRFMTGGEIGGTLRFKAEVLDTARNTLNEIAVGLSVTVNQQHANGIDLDGQQGLNFFSAPVVVAQTTSGTGTLSVTVSDPSLIQNSEYTVSIDAGGNYTITNLSGGVPSTGVIGASVAFEGLTFDLSGVAASSAYSITSPTKNAAENFALALTNPRDIAAALPVVSETTVTNTGTGGLSSIEVNGLAASTLPASVTLTYAANQYTVTNVTGAPLILNYDPTTDSGSEYTVNVAGFGDITFTLTGQPNDTDSFTLVNNTGGIGDNRNARFLADLQTSLTLSGGTASFQDVYGQVVADVGRRTQSAEINGAAQNGLLAQTVASKDAVSGVSLDEEAANLIRFQQAYQAASQVILTSRTIFDTLLGAFR